MAAETTRYKIGLPKPRGIQSGCRTKKYDRSAVYPTMQKTGRGRGRGSRVVPMVVGLPGSSLLLSYWSSQLS